MIVFTWNVGVEICGTWTKWWVLKKPASPKNLKNQSKIPCWGHSFIFGGGEYLNLTILWQKGLNPCSQIQPRQLERDGMTLFILQSSNMAGCNIHLFWQANSNQWSLRIDYCIPSYFPNCHLSKFLKTGNLMITISSSDLTCSSCSQVSKDLAEPPLVKPLSTWRIKTNKHSMSCCFNLFSIWWQ